MSVAGQPGCGRKHAGQASYGGLPWGQLPSAAGMTTLEVIAGEAMRRWYHLAAEALAGALAVSRAVADEVAVAEADPGEAWPAAEVVRYGGGQVPLLANVE
jgi:hypothetical protein